MPDRTFARQSVYTGMVHLLLALSLVQSGAVDLKFEIDGVARTAIAYRSSIPDQPSPVVFVFHGFTGNARQAAFSYRVHSAWPEATVVYPQGLDVPLLGRNAPGWQIAPALQGGRDLKFFDAMLAKVKADFRGDPARVYTCGMSNGAIFSYVLLSERAKTLAAAAPVAGYAPAAFKGAPPTPVLITHGKGDTLLPFRLAERSREWAVENNGAGSKEAEWMPGYVRYEPVKDGNDVVWREHPGGHTWPPGTTEAIVRFFKQHTRKG